MTEKPDLDHLREWVGRSTQASDIVTAQLVKGLRATLFMDIDEPKRNDEGCPAVRELAQAFHDQRFGFGVY